jgi:hypothetical protein
MRVWIGPYKHEGKRKEQVSIHDYDTWAMDHTLSLITLPMLKQLQATKHGAPSVDNEDVPENLRVSIEEYYQYKRTGETDPNFFKRWDYVLDEMIFAMTAIVYDDEDVEYNFDDETWSVSEIKSVGIGAAQLRLFPDEFGEMEDYELYEMTRTGERPRYDREKYEAREERINNGTRLFGKYFRSLWD